MITEEDPRAGAADTRAPHTLSSVVTPRSGLRQLAATFSMDAGSHRLAGTLIPHYKPWDN